MDLLRPLVAVSGASPRLDDVAGSIEFDHRRRRHTTRLLDGLATVNDPDVVAGVGRNAADGSHDPTIRKRLRPRRIDFEGRYVACRLRVRDRHHPAAEPDKSGE